MRHLSSSSFKRPEMLPAEQLHSDRDGFVLPNSTLIGLNINFSGERQIFARINNSPQIPCLLVNTGFRLEKISVFNLH